MNPFPRSTPTPVVVGVADFKNRSTKVEDAIEPLQLMLQAISQAISDTGLSSTAARRLQSEIDSVSVVNTWSWRYPELPGLISNKLGIKAKYEQLSHHGGDAPAKFFDETSRRISSGESRVAIITGGEALASLSACAASGNLPPPGWTKPDESGKRISVSEIGRVEANMGTRHSFGLPIHVYPLYENSFRAHRGQTFQENNAESAELYADFATVAEENPAAWNYGLPAASKRDIGTVSKKNRMICFPYPLLMNAFNNINLAGACLLTSTEYAKELGISEDRWIYPLGGAGVGDSKKFWERPNYHSSPAISRSLDAGLKVCGLEREDVDVFDFYSCFPIVPKLACKHLGFPITKQHKPISLLGGLTSFGGAGNNYSMHALIEMVRELRKGKCRTGLILANGGTLTYQYVVCLSNEPRQSPYPDRNPLEGDFPSDSAVPIVEEQAEGEATIEAYTVEFKRDGSPLRGYIIGRLSKNNHRFIGNHGDEKTLRQLGNGVREPVGRRGFVRVGDDGRNLFVLDEAGRI